MTRKYFVLKFDAACKKYSDRTSISFLTCLSSPSSQCMGLSYKNLKSLVHDLKMYLKELFSDKYEYIGISINEKECLIPVLLALWQTSKSPAFINSSNFEQMCETTESAWFITDASQSTKFNDEKYECFDKFVIFEHSLHVYKRKSKTSILSARTLDVCYAVSTSGSTGAPKIVQVPWTCIIPNAEELANIFTISAADVIASTAPPTFDPFFIELFCCLTNGSHLFIHSVFQISAPCSSRHQRKQDIQNDPKKVFNPRAESISPPQMTILQVTPSLFKLFVMKNWTSLCKNLRVLVLGGELFPMLVLPNFKGTVYNIYGITELSCWSFIKEVKISDTGVFESVSIGTPLEGIVFQIEDGELLLGSQIRKCLVGEENMDQLDVVTYRRTGDLVSRHPITQELLIIGRKDNLIKKFGTKVSMKRTEELLRSCSIIENHYIVYEAQIQIVSWFLVIKNFEAEQEYSQICCDQYPELSTILQSISDVERPDVIFAVRELPLTLHGKTNVLQLRQILKKTFSVRRFEDLEKVFQHIWCDALHLTQNPAEETLKKTFQENGGSSILALKIVARLEAMGVAVPPTLLSLLLGASSYQDCVKSIILYNNNAQMFVEKTITEENNETRDTRLDEETVPRLRMKIQWTHNMNKCVDAPPQILTLDGNNFVAIGSHSSELSMVSCESGKVVWTVCLGDRIESGIAVSSNGELLFTGCYDNCLYCLSSRTGKIVWKLRTGGMIKSTPVLSDDSTYVYCGSYDKQMYCLSTEDGSVVCSLALGASVLATPLLTHSQLVTCTLNGSVTAIHPRSFQVIWQKKVASPIFSSPCFLKDSRVLVAEVEGRIHCFNVENGRKEWMAEIGSNIFSGLVAVPGHELVTFGSQDGHLYLLSTQPTASIKWKLPVESSITSTPAVHNNQIICAASVGVVHLTNLQGHRICSIKLDGEIFSGPKLVNDRIFVGCRNDNLICLSIEDDVCPDDT